MTADPISRFIRVEALRVAADACRNGLSKGTADRDRLSAHQLQMACWSGDDGTGGHRGRGAAAVLLGSGCRRSVCRFAAFLLFGLQHEPSGYAVLVVSVILGFVVDRDLGKSLLLIGFGIGHHRNDLTGGRHQLRPHHADGKRAAHRRRGPVRGRPLRLQASHRAVSGQDRPTMDHRGALVGS